MKRVVIFIAFMLMGVTSCDKLRNDSHFIHDGYKVMYGEYEVTSVICFPEHMPEHLIESETEKILESRLLQDESKLTINQNMTYFKYCNHETSGNFHSIYANWFLNANFNTQNAQIYIRFFV